MYVSKGFRKQYNRVCAGQRRSTAPSAEEPVHISDWSDPAPTSNLCRVRRYSTGLLHGVRLMGTHSTARCRAKCLLRHTSLHRELCMARTLAMLNQGNTAPVRACIFLWPYRASSLTGALPNAPETAHLGSLELCRIYDRICPSNFCILGDLLVVSPCSYRKECPPNGLISLALS
jgi:hypothetical protein